jgi:prevent-host-death family protein
MKRASITEAKNNLSALIDSVKSGTPVLILDRGRPVARLEPVSGTTGTDDERLARLVRAGLVRPGRGVIPRSIIDEPPPRFEAGLSVLEALLEERREGR